MFLGILMNIGFGVLIAHFIGKKRHIGFKWSLFFCFFLHFIVGLIITLFSKKISQEPPSKSTRKKIIGFLLILTFLMTLIASFSELFEKDKTDNVDVLFQMISLSIGWMGLGLYLINSGKTNKQKEDLRLLFFDTETTGLPKNWDAPLSDTNNWPRLVQIAWLLYDGNGELLSKENYIIKPVGFKIPKSASDIHNITNKIALEEGVVITDILDKFYKAVEDSDLLVAHNISYDTNIMGAEFIRYNQNNILESRRKFCTMKSSVNFCAIPGFKGYKWPKLIELYRKLFSKDFNPHNALDDVEATADCFWELKKKKIIKPF